ncbi:MAG: Ig-like domain-containing protein, partial [Anaerolineales bacterium]|nr:Ig-like domain-containing protein [Anaerolineales bacterium]
IRFSVPMDPLTTEAALAVRRLGSSQPVPLTVAWDETGQNVVITPTVRLALDARYLFTVAETARAADGGGMTDGYSWSFRTVGEPSTHNLEPAPATVQAEFSSVFKVAFVSPMAAETVLNRIIIEPDPPEQAEWWVSYDGRTFGFAGLKPSTEYQVHFLPGMEDVWGNVISGERQYSFTTAGLRPYLYIRDKGAPALVSQQGPQRLYLTMANVPRVHLSLYQLTPEQFSLRYTDVNAEPVNGELLRQWTVAPGLAQDTPGIRYFLLRLAGGEPLPTGFYRVVVDSPDHPAASSTQDTLDFFVATTNLIIKSSASQSLIWATDLVTGEPVAGLPIRLFDQGMKLLATGQTDSSGLVTFEELPPLESYRESRIALAGEADGDYRGLAYSHYSYELYPNGVGIDTDFLYQTGQPLVYLYSDRPVYRPGQPVAFKGIMRIDNDMAYELPGPGSVVATVRYFGQDISRQVLRLSATGSFTGSLTLPADALPGTYTLFVRPMGSAATIGNLAFSVAAYQKPTFSVTLHNEQPDRLQGDNGTVTVQADYYAGGSLNLAEVTWHLDASEQPFLPPEPYRDYSFWTGEGRPGYWRWRWRGRYVYPTMLAFGSAVTNEQGQAILDIPIRLEQFNADQQLTLQVNVTDFAGRTVTSRTIFRAHQSEIYPGVRPESYVASVASPVGIDLVTLDMAGQTLPEQALRVELFRVERHSVRTFDEFGRAYWETTSEEVLVGELTGVQTDDQGVTSTDYSFAEAGLHLIRVTGQDQYGNSAVAENYVWVVTGDYVSWGMRNNFAMDLIPNQTEFVPGETAQILIASPFPGEHYALVTVERGQVRHSEVIQVAGSDTVYELPLTAALAPNVYVSVVVFKAAGDAAGADMAIGWTELAVAPAQFELQIELAADRPVAGPGETVTYEIQVLDQTGNGVAADVSLALVDLAVVSLVEPNSAPIFEFFYRPRRLAVQTGSLLTNNLDQLYEELGEVAKGGGGGPSGQGVVDVREDFRDTAAWRGFVTTDANGRATVTVTLPHNLTTWRLDVRAATLNQFGQGTHDLVANKLLYLQPQTPYFFVSGDEVQLGAIVRNNSEATQTVTVTLEQNGLSLLSPEEQQFVIPAGAQILATWTVRADQATPQADLLFRVTSPEFSDASRPETGTLPGGGIPIQRPAVQEAQLTAGLLTSAGSNLEGVYLPPELTTYEGELTITLQPSLLLGLHDSLAYLEEQPFSSHELPVSRFLANVATRRTLAASAAGDPHLAARLDSAIETAIARLYRTQTLAGGWGYWVDGPPQPLLTAYTLLGLLEAEAAGYAVRADVQASAQAYLEQQMGAVTPQLSTYELNRIAFINFVLARAGEVDVSTASQLLLVEQQLSLYARALLLQTLHLIDPADPRLPVLLGNLLALGEMSAQGWHWQELEPDPWNWNSDGRTTAIILLTILTIDPEQPGAANVVRWLMNNRVRDHWHGTQETTWSLLALHRWLMVRAELEPAYSFSLRVNDALLAEGAVTDLTATSWTLSLEELGSGPLSIVEISRSEGAGNLYYTAALTAQLPVTALTPLDQGLMIERRYFALDDPETPVTVLRQGESYLARITLISPYDRHFVLLEDPLPAGANALDATLRSNPWQRTGGYPGWGERTLAGWGWWYFDRVTLLDDRLQLAATWLPAGCYEYTYLIRANLAGQFNLLPITAQELYFPDVMGRGAGQWIEILPYAEPSS